VCATNVPVSWALLPDLLYSGRFRARRRPLRRSDLRYIEYAHWHSLRPYPTPCTMNASHCVSLPRPMPQQRRVLARLCYAAPSSVLDDPLRYRRRPGYSTDGYWRAPLRCCRDCLQVLHRTLRQSVIPGCVDQPDTEYSRRPDPGAGKRLIGPVTRFPFLRRDLFPANEADPARDHSGRLACP